MIRKETFASIQIPVLKTKSHKTMHSCTNQFYLSRKAKVEVSLTIIHKIRVSKVKTFTTKELYECAKVLGGLAGIATKQVKTAG